MREQDILNAIDEVDLKYVTQAWENTQPSTEEKRRLSDKRRVNFAAIGAGIAAVLLAGFVTVTFMRGSARLPVNSNTSNAGVTPGISVSDTSDNSGETSKAPQSSDSAVTSEPTVVDVNRKDELYAPDGTTFTYDKNDEHCSISSNGTTITFDNFAYLGEPKNVYNSITNPNFFVMSSEAFGGAGVENKAMLKLCEQEVPYKRFYVGDKYHDLTLVSAKTVYMGVGGDDQLWRGNRLLSMAADFEGTTKFPAVIYSYDGVYFAIPMPQNVPGGGTYRIPAMSFLQTDYNGDFTTKGAFTPVNDNVLAHSDVVIRLNNPEAFGLADMINEGAVVSVELTDVHVEYSTARSGVRDVDLTTASIESIELLPLDWGSTYEKTTDAYTTIENYFREYVFDAYGLTDRTNRYTLLSVTETTEDVEKIREELSNAGQNPGETPKNPDCAELIHDYEVTYYDGKNKVTAACRLIHDEGFSDLWAVLSSQTINTVEGDYIEPRESN